MKALVSENKLTEKSRVGYGKQFFMQQVGQSLEESVTGLKLGDFGRWRLAGPTCCRYSTSAMGHYPERPLMAESVRSPPAALEHSSSQNLGLADQLVCRNLADRRGSGV